MFTVKYYRENGSRFVHSCDNYVFNPPQEPAAGDDSSASVALYEKPISPDSPQSSKAVIHIFDGDSVYIENANGHTVDVIRPSKLI